MELARFTLELHVSEALDEKRIDRALAKLDDPEALERIRRSLERHINRDPALAGVAVTVRD